MAAAGAPGQPPRRDDGQIGGHRYEDEPDLPDYITDIDINEQIVRMASEDVRKLNPRGKIARSLRNSYIYQEQLHDRQKRKWERVRGEMQQQANKDGRRIKHLEERNDRLLDRIGQLEENVDQLERERARRNYEHRNRRSSPPGHRQRSPTFARDSMSRSIRHSRSRSRSPWRPLQRIPYHRRSRSPYQPPRHDYDRVGGPSYPRRIDSYRPARGHIETSQYRHSQDRDEAMHRDRSVSEDGLYRPLRRPMDGSDRRRRDRGDEEQEMDYGDR